ncbi:N-acetylglutamate synthase, GNAT family [Dyella sp. OK004]|uniref:GNAT family N-acetyltransferase n=1 Tax=Dyella sp. OK004 TaxID=1855292 RepID=UPI0008E54DBC|nr:GNAT family N-acetyltransferase [Dyella sp. OK004]SFS13344.1 N-acetylglutamate synthase, GNAT family [Dyella sp. OK004]
MSGLREARLDDATEIARLSGELGYPATASEIATRLTALLDDPAHRISVVETAGVLLGWIAVECRMTLESGERAEIVGLVVGEEARRQGVGRMLIDDAEAWARALGFATLVVRSNVLRDASHAFYRRQGYVHRKTQHVYAKALDAVD